LPACFRPAFRKRYPVFRLRFRCVFLSIVVQNRSSLITLSAGLPYGGRYDLQGAGNGKTGPADPV
jgi:hypothetical protein